MSKNKPSKLRFNLGFLVEADLGTSRTIELDYPTIEITPDMVLSPFQGTIFLSRVSEGVYVSGVCSTAVPTTCVRCLEDTNLSITIEFDEIFYYPPGAAPESEFVVGDNGYIDLAPLVRELVLLAMPIKPLCKPDCQGLCVSCGQNLNIADCGCEEDDIDPRMAALRELLDK